MLSALIAGLPPSLVLLWTSYGSPSLGLLPSSASATPFSFAAISRTQSISQIVSYTLMVPLPGENKYRQDEVALTMDGRCWVGVAGKGSCDPRLIGDWASKLTPLLISYQIFYGLLTFSLILGVLTHFVVKGGRAPARRPEIKAFRSYTLFVMLLGCFAGLISVCASVAMILLPLFDPSIDTILDLSIGWAFVIAVFAMIYGCMLTAGYENWSARLMMHAVEGGIALDDNDNDNDNEEEEISISISISGARSQQSQPLRPQGDVDSRTRSTASVDLVDDHYLSLFADEKELKLISA
ncbi:hypothetical protein I317_05683 [Kwoniella heveanensis CBS 569]|nr:hypothetical protein I317_05683 [Kwoniella heveanensis CBS 569]